MPILQESALMWGALVRQPPLALFSVLVIAWLAQVDGICDWLKSTVHLETHFLKKNKTSFWYSFHLMSLCLTELSYIVDSLCMSDKNVENWTNFCYHECLSSCHLHCQTRSMSDENEIIISWNQPKFIRTSSCLWSYFFPHFSSFLTFSCCIQAHLVASGQPQQVPQGQAPPSASVPPTAQQVSIDMKSFTLFLFLSHTLSLKKYGVLCIITLGEGVLKM